MADQYYLEAGYVEQGYFERIVVSDAISFGGAFTPSFSVDIADATGYYIPDYIADGYYAAPVIQASANLSSTVNVNAVGTRIQQGAASVASNFALENTAGKILDASADLGALFTPNISGIISVNMDAILDSVSSMSTSVNVTRNNDIALSTLVNLSLQGDKVVSSSTAVSSAFSFAADVNLIAGTLISLDSTAQLSTTIYKITQSDATFTSVASVFAAPDRDVFNDYTRLETSSYVYCNPAVLGLRNNITITDNLDYDTIPSPKFGLTESAQIQRTNLIAYGLSAENIPFADYPLTSTNYELIIDFWIYNPAVSTQIFSIDNGSENIVLTLSSSSKLRLVRNGSLLEESVSAPFVSNQWNHVVVAYRAGTGQGYNIFVNGTQVIRETLSNIPTGLTDLLLGYNTTGTPTGSAHIDEFRILLGSSGVLLNKYYGININSTSLTVPTVRPEDTEETLLLLHLDQSAQGDDYNPPYTDILRLDFGVESYVTADVDRIKGTITTVSSQFATNIVANTTASASATSQSVASVSVIPEKIRSFDINVSAQATQTTDASKTISAIVDATATLTLDSTATRIKQFNIATDSIATQLTAVAIIGQGLITSESAFTSTVTAQKTVDISLELSSAFTSSVSAERYRTITETYSSAFTQSQTVDLFKRYNANMSSEVVCTVDAVKTTDVSSANIAQFVFTVDLDGFKEGFADFESIATQLTAVAKTGAGLVTVESVATVSADADFTVDPTLEMNSVASLQSDAARTRGVDSDNLALFAQTSDINVITDTSAQFDSTSALSADPAGSVFAFASAQSSEFTQDTTGVKTVDVDSALDSTSALVINAVVGVVAEGAFTATTTMTVDNDRIRNVRIGYAGDRIAKTISTYGNVEISTAQSKFGSGSALITDTGDYFTVPGDSSLYNGNFTVEMWLYASNLTSIPNGNIWDNRTSSTSGMYLYVSYGSIGLGEGISIKGLTSAGFNNNQWNHIALVRNGTNAKVFVNGVQKISATVTTTNYSNRTTYIGSTYTGSTPMRSYFDEVRLSSSARYTTGFTPSTTAFTSDGDVRALLHLDTDFNDDVGYAPGLEAFVSTLTAAAKVGNTLVDMVSTASLTADANVLAENLVPCEVFANISIDAERIRSTDSNFDGGMQAILIVVAISEVSSSADLTASSTLGATANVIRGATADLGSLFSPSITVNAQRAGEIATFTAATLELEPTRIRLGVADINSIATIQAIGGITVSASADISSAFSLSADGKFIVLLDQLTYVIPRETRSFTIDRESRGFTIHRETRTYTILE